MTQNGSEGFKRKYALLIKTFLLYPAFMDALIKVYFYIPI